MTERHTKQELLTRIDEAWTALNAALDQLSPQQMTDIRDEQGWNVRDHLVHIAAWERSMTTLLQGQPRYVGLGVDEHTYRTNDEDGINAAIQQQHQDLAPADALRELRSVHQLMLALIEPLSDEELYLPDRHFLPNDPSASSESPVIYRIDGNTAHHFNDHLGWITALVDTPHSSTQQSDS